MAKTTPKFKGPLSARRLLDAQPVVGGYVWFHMLAHHRCADDHCKCKCDLHLHAKVIDLYPGSDDLVLEVEFPDEYIDTDGHEMDDHNGEPITTTVTTHGYRARQTRCPKATTTPPASGTWTATLNGEPPWPKSQ